MSWLHLLLVQAAPAAEPPPRVEFDLADAERRRSEGEAQCRGQGSSDIVVCGRRRSLDEYRAKELPYPSEQESLRAEVDLGGGVTADAYMESVEVVPGAKADRVMVRVKVPF